MSGLVTQYSLLILAERHSRDNQMNVIGLIVNTDKKAALEISGDLASKIEGRGVRVCTEASVAPLIGRPELAADDEVLASSDMLIVLGGDGTVLRASKIAAPKGTPMLGVHFGQYGFITQIHPPELDDALDRVLAGDFQVEDRLMLRADLIRGEETVQDLNALNDVVVSKGPLARMLNLHTSVAGQFVATYAADGIIVSSPTGSTAYSLSAGGPVVNPNVRVLIITPICPHTLNARSLVIPEDEQVQILAECEPHERDVMMTVDGQVGVPVRCGDKITVRKAGFPARLVVLDPWHFYDKIQSRLKWGERFSQ